LIQQNSEFKEKTALHEQKVNHLEKMLDDLKSREKELEMENKNLNKNHQSAIKELQTKLEMQIKTIDSKLVSENEARIAAEKELEETQDRLSKLKSSFDSEITKYQSRIDELTSQNKLLTQSFDKKEKDFSSKVRETEKLAEEVASKLKKQVDDLDRRTKKSEDALKSEISKLDKENAVKSQQIEFFETQVRELKEQLDEERKQHTMMMASLSCMTDSSKNLELELEALKEKHANEMKYSEAQHEAVKKELMGDIEKLTQSKTDIELRYKLDSSEWIQKHENLAEDIQTLTSDKEKIKENNAELKRIIENMQSDFENKFKARVGTLEKQIDEVTERLSLEIEMEKKNAEKSFALLKENYETEKKRLENRLAEEKEKYEKKVKVLTEDYEEKIRQDMENYEEEIECKDQEIRELEQYMNEQVNQLKNQLSLDNQKIETLERYVKDLKSQHESQERNYNHLIDQNQIRFNHERTSLQDKIDKLTSELSTKERETAMMTFQKQQSDSQLLQKSDELKDIKIELDSLKSSNIKKFEDLKENNRKMTEEIISLKSDYKREVALIAQENDFKTARVQELEKSLRDTEEKYRESLKLLKNGGHDSAVIEKLTSDKDILMKKLQEKKKTMKQLQAGFSKQSSELEREKSQMNEKIMSLERTLADLEFKAALEKDRPEGESRFDIESTVFNDEVDQLKSQVQDLEHELTSCKALLDREKLLWENKFKFLAEQRESAKNDLAEAQRKFEFTLQQIQRREQNGKEKQEGTLNSLVSSIEARYNSKVKDLQDFSNSTIEHLNLKIKLLEQESKGLKEELEIARRGKHLIHGNIEKRCRQLQEMEGKLLGEIENLRAEKERKSKEVMDINVLERENMRGRATEMEKKMKDAESAKAQMYLELEKERSKWQMERDHLLAAKNEALENFEAMQNKQEMLLRENERLKGDKARSRGMQSKRIEHHKAFSSQAAGSPSKLQEFYSHRVDLDSIRNDSFRNDSFRNDSQGSYRKRSFAD
jgi:chromosome segregation ATPase